MVGLFPTPHKVWEGPDWQRTEEERESSGKKTPQNQNQENRTDATVLCTAWVYTQNKSKTIISDGKKAQQQLKKENKMLYNTTKQCIW